METSVQYLGYAYNGSSAANSYKRKETTIQRMATMNAESEFEADEYSDTSVHKVDDESISDKRQSFGSSNSKNQQIYLSNSS